MTCNEIRDRLVDYLYGELPAEERRLFEAHLPGCEACRREVEGMGTTLERARVALRADEPPPARVRAAVLAAAAAAARPAAVSHGEGAGDSLGRRLRDWFRRPWLLPAFAAASLMAVFVLGRHVIVAPERAAAPPAAAPEPLRATGAAAPAPAMERAEPVPPADVGRQIRREAPAASHAPAHASRPRAAAPKAPSARWTQPPPPATSPAFDEDLVERDSALARPQREPPSANVAGAGIGAGAEHKAKAEGAAPAEEAPAARKKSARADAEGGRMAPAAAPPPAPRMQDLASGSARPAGGAALDELVRRADEAFTEGRWGAAAADYRELLRRFPGHARAAAWRARLQQSEAALAR